MAFTSRDTPQVVGRIRRDLDLAVERVRRADPQLRALVLTGGFARGEGAVRAGQPQNDYDLVAVRGLGRPRAPYASVRQGLEDALGMHIDLAPVAAVRLRWAPRSIFWYETALRGQVLWGHADVLDAISVRRPLQIARDEAIRLLANRAAGLVFASTEHAEEQRLQSSKALLASMDAWLLAEGVFPPTQTGRWEAWCALRAQHVVPERLDRIHAWLAWAFAYKTQPDSAPRRDGTQAWQQAARAVLEAVPDALEHARLRSLDALARQDSVVDHLMFLHRRRANPGLRAMRHPSSRVRVATLQTLRSLVEDGHPGPWLAQLAGPREPPLHALATLRAATLQ